MTDQWQYVAVRRDNEAGAWVARGPAEVQLPTEDDPLVVANAVGAQGWRLVDRQAVREFRGGPSIELLFTRPVRPGAPPPPAEVAVAAEVVADDVSEGDAPFEA